MFRDRLKVEGYNMLRWKKRVFTLNYMFWDFVAIVLTRVCIHNIFIINKTAIFTNTTTELYLYFLLFLVIIPPLHLFLGTYDKIMRQTSFFSFKIFVRSLMISIIGICIIYSLSNLIRFYIQIDYILYFFIIFYLLSYLFKTLLSFFYKNYNHENSNVRRIILVGHSLKGEEYYKEIVKYTYLNIHIIGYVHIKEINKYKNIPHLGHINDLKEIVYSHAVDEIAVTRPISYHPKLKESISFCEHMGLTVTMILDCQNLETKTQVAMVGNLPVLKFHIVSLNETQLFIKRLLDIIGASVGMILFFIAFIIITPLIKFESHGPVIFKQKRVGKNGRIFNIYKFRSMVSNADDLKKSLLHMNEVNGHMFKINNDPRVTKIGKFIRKTSIDELPQFWNVLKGDMSLVGTRPPTIDEFNEYSTHHYKRIAIPPGITGYWQISGRSNITDFEKVVMLDTQYINNWTIFEDIKILFKTVFIVLVRKGSK